MATSHGLFPSAARTAGDPAFLPNRQSAREVSGGAPPRLSHCAHSAIRGYRPPRLQGSIPMQNAFASLELRLALLEDKVNTLTAIVAKFGLLSPDVIELKLAVSSLTLVVSDEAARTAAVEVAQGHWNDKHNGAASS